ncbi:MAG: aldose 1-epimerase [Candidatus Saccharibacteria bacterium]|nr:aldose 1-epimerase [Pseudorhodobacter sp.]
MSAPDLGVHLHVLSSDRMSLSVDAAYGARVTDLTDRATGRQWLLTGPRAEDTSDAVAYRGAASRGWDECFPTILPCDDPISGHRLRDHGMLWGRPWTVVEATPHHLTTRFQGADITFTRSLTVQGAELMALYTLTSARAEKVPYLWSQHCVLRTTASDRLALAGQGLMTADGTTFSWPDHPARNLTRVGPQDEGFVLKAYAQTPISGMAQICGPDGGLRFDWDGTEVPSLGLWLDYGGWPEEAPLHQLAIEPTTAPADDLAGAVQSGQARWLAPGETHRWSVRLTLLDPEEGPVP